MLHPAITKVSESPDIFSITLPYSNPFGSDTNCYVVKDSGESLIIDSGDANPGALRILQEALEALDVSMGQAIHVLTHLHIDHSGLTDCLAASGGCVLASKAYEGIPGRPYIEEKRAALGQALRMEGALEADLDFIDSCLAASFFIPDRPNMRFVGGGDSVTVGRYAFDVVETPGHTEGHISLFERSSRCLLAGDLILPDLTPSIEIPQRGGNPIGDFLESLEKVHALRCEKALLSHGELSCGVDERIFQLTGHTRKRLNDVLDAVRFQPGLNGDSIIKKVYRLDGQEDWLKTRAMRRMAILSKGAALLSYLVSEGSLNKSVNARGVAEYFPVDSPQG